MISWGGVDSDTPISMRQGRRPAETSAAGGTGSEARQKLTSNKPHRVAIRDRFGVNNRGGKLTDGSIQRLSRCNSGPQVQNNARRERIAALASAAFTWLSRPQRASCECGKWR